MGKKKNPSITAVELEDIHIEVSNLLAGKEEYVGRTKVIYMSREIPPREICGIFMHLRNKTVTVNFNPLICHFLWLFCNQKL